MKATQILHDLGQSLWLDNITRDLLNSGTLKSYIDQLSVTGLTSNPTIFDHAIKNSKSYDSAIQEKIGRGQTGEALFFELALEDLTRAADLFGPIHDQTKGVDGWVSLEVSPLLAYDTATSLTEAKSLHARANRPNLFIKIPGTPQGLPAIEEAIFAGVSINVTLLFSREQYLAAADAYLKAIERRIAAGLDTKVGSVASLFISRWDVAVTGQGAGRIARQARHRDRQTHIQGVLRTDGFTALAGHYQSRLQSAALVVGKHRDQRPQSFGCALRQSARCTEYDKHHAGGHVEGPC